MEPGGNRSAILPRAFAATKAQLRRPTRARHALRVILLAALLGTGCEPAARLPGPPAAAPAPAPARTVRVAAIQFHSVMGDPEGNRRRLAPLVERAAAGGAKIVVLPEAAVPGYADLSTDTFWSSSDEDEPGYLRASAVAETVPGPSTELFAPLARRLGIYLTVPVIERVDGKRVDAERTEGESAGARYYNTVALMSPAGEVAAVHRKHNIWPVADASWASEGPRWATVVDTPYGRLGLMICYDVHALLPLMGEARADVVLHSVAFFGPNSGDWFGTTLAARAADAGVSLVLANWTFDEAPGWSGWGASCAISSSGEVVASAPEGPGDLIVIADVPSGAPAASEGSTRRAPPR